jgi:hypothetical protein
LKASLEVQGKTSDKTNASGEPLPRTLKQNDLKAKSIRRGARSRRVLVDEAT